MKKTCLLRLVFMVALLFLTGCAAGHNTAAYVVADEGFAGFWLGLWHGMIMPITFIISLFLNNVNIYEVHNNGGLYNFGFVLGIVILFGVSDIASSRMS